MPSHRGYNSLQCTVAVIVYKLNNKIYTGKYYK